MATEKEEGNKRARIVGKNPKSMRFCGFFLQEPLIFLPPSKK